MTAPYVVPSPLHRIVVVALMTVALLSGLAWSSVLTQAQLSSYVPPYLAPGPIEDGLPAHLILIYSGYYERARRGLDDSAIPTAPSVARSDGGDWLAHDFLPFVAHLNWDGEPDDTFFDSFLFLGLSSGRGRHYAGERGQESASLWADWQWYIDRLFAPEKQLDALNQAVSTVGAALGEADYSVNVYIMIPYPSYLVTDFGHPDGQMDGMPLLPVGNRQQVVEWYVDEVLKRWDAFQPERLNLAGFYWLQEHINPAVPDEEAFVRDVVAYVQGRNYKIGWIPWSGAYLATRWRSYGFDWAIIQPNHMFRDQPNMLQIAAERGRNSRMGIEIELDGRVKQPAGEQKLYEYLDAGLQYGYMQEAMIGYYQDVAMLAQLYYEESGRWRYMYDDIYAFAKGTYPGPTAAAGRVQGIVRDTAGNPVVGAEVRSGQRVAVTNSAGAFELDGLYTAQADLLIMKPGFDPIVALVATARAGAEPVMEGHTLLPATGHVLHALDTVTGLGRIGVALTAVPEPKSEGDGSVRVTVQSPSIASVRIPPDTNDQNWSNSLVMAFDALVPGADSIKIQVTLRDAAAQTYTRTFVLAPGNWHTVAIPLSDAKVGRYHEPLVPESLGKIDVTQVSLVTLAISAEARTEVLIDNLRLLGRHE